MTIIPLTIGLSVTGNRFRKINGFNIRTVARSSSSLTNVTVEGFQAGACGPLGNSISKLILAIRDMNLSTVQQYTPEHAISLEKIFTS